MADEVETIPTNAPLSAREQGQFSSRTAAASRLTTLVEREEWDPNAMDEMAAVAASYNNLQDEEDVGMLQQFNRARIQRRSFITSNLERFLKIQVPGPEKAYAKYQP